jgi:hypothetical protein
LPDCCFLCFLFFLTAPTGFISCIAFNNVADSLTKQLLPGKV